jgi:O-antigen biosynthesis protein
VIAPARRSNLAAVGYAAGVQRGGVDPEVGGLLDDGTVLLSRSEFTEWMRGRIEARAPTAALRFGDGEARMLLANPAEEESITDAIRKLRRETGLSLSAEDVLEIGALVSYAYDEADVLGIRYGEPIVDEHRAWMDRLHAIYAERVARGRPAATLAYGLLSHDLLEPLPGMLAGRKVSVISCRDVKSVLEGEWGLEDVVVHQVPSQHLVRDVDGAYEAAQHGVPIWPDVHARLRAELRVRERGEVFLVGAGVFGKDFCIRIRERGGIAIDMGSALDRIAGKLTRGPERRVLDFHVGGMSVPEIADRLRELYGAEVEHERIARALEDALPDPEIDEGKLGTLPGVPEAEVDLGERRARLDEELRRTQREARRLGRRLETLERERAERIAVIGAVEAEIGRTAGSRSFRYGHGIMRRISRWLLRRPARQSGLDAAAELLDGARRSLAAPGLAAAPPFPQAPPSAPRANGSRAPAPPRGRQADLASEREGAMREGFRARYAAIFERDGAAPLGEDELSGSLPRDHRGMLLGSAADSEPEHPGVDVVVCVRDAPEDVRTCLWSLLHSATRPFHLIVVDDGSGPETAAMLATLAQREPEVELIRNEGPEHGYTRAANIGLRASTGAHVVLLNSDTIVTPFWIERIVACAESDSRIGVVGPLSNAATHQSVPAVTEEGRWAVNELPAWLTVDSMALLVAELSGQEMPRVPFVNGFCYAITREALDRVGLFDEELFGSGYCEENDFCIRARDDGFLAALADDAYVFHSKSRSYTSAGRDEVARRNYGLFLEKHGEGRVKEMLSELEEIGELTSLRETTAIATSTEAATVDAFRAANPEPLELLFVLHGMSEGSGGGVHSIYQETKGMRRLGVPARIAIATEAMERARASYPDADDLFVAYAGEAELGNHAAGADVVVATHYSTVTTVGRLRERYGDFLPAYYAQDYEPFFTEAGSSQLIAALDSYTAFPGQLLFAKTHWLRNLIGHLHGVDVAKVEPSLDRELFSTEGREERAGGPVRIAAMIRPRTPRRQPVLTLDVLSEIVARHGDGVEVTTFGCPADSIEALGRRSAGRHLGLLSRQDVAQLLKRTDVFLDASTYQAFGRTALEAMACGATAIVPEIGGAGQFVRHEENGLLAETLRPEAVTEALTRLVEDDELRHTLQTAAVEEASNHSILRAALSEYALFARERDRLAAGSPAGAA